MEYTPSDLLKVGWPPALTVKEKQQLFERIEEKPGTLVWGLIQRTGQTHKIVCRTLRAEDIHPYSILTLQEMQSPVFEKCRNFCTWFKNQFDDNVEEQAYHIFYG